MDPKNKLIAGIFAGPSHKQGGISCNEGQYELEGGEAYISREFAMLTPKKQQYEGTAAQIFDEILAEQNIKKTKITEEICNLSEGYVICKAAMQSHDDLFMKHDGTDKGLNYRELLGAINQDFGCADFGKYGFAIFKDGGKIKGVRKDFKLTQEQAIQKFLTKKEAKELSKIKESKISDEDKEKAIKNLKLEISAIEIDIPDPNPIYAGCSYSMHKDLIQTINSWETINKSPFSCSLYNFSGKTWHWTKPGGLRISDHWDIEDVDKMPPENTWAVGEFVETEQFQWTDTFDENEWDELIQNGGKTLFIKDDKWTAEFRRADVRLPEGSMVGNKGNDGYYKIIAEYPFLADAENKQKEELLSQKKIKIKILLATENNFGNYEDYLEYLRIKGKLQEKYTNHLFEKYLKKGLIKGSVTKREYDKYRGGWRLLDETTYTGIVIKKSPNMITIKTPDGKIFQGKDYSTQNLHSIEKEIKKEVSELKLKHGGPITVPPSPTPSQVDNDENYTHIPTNPAHFTAPANTPFNDYKELHTRLHHLIENAEPRRRFLTETNRLTELCTLNDCCEKANAMLQNGNSILEISYCCGELSKHLNGTIYAGGGEIGSEAAVYQLQSLSDLLQSSPIILPQNEKEFVADIVVALTEGETLNKLKVEKFAKNNGITKFHQAQELTELAIVKMSRSIALQKASVEYKYDKIVKLYQQQPNLAHRTTTTFLKQQYSTPAPIAYLAGHFCQVDVEAMTYKKTFFEPSAGNGLLTIAGKAENFIVNELDDTRRKHLWPQEFKEVWNKDASDPFTGYANYFDAVITNPPFGNTEPVQYDNFEITGLEHLMALRALDTMQDTGRAAIIIGGHTKYDELGRIQAGKNRNFFMYLYKHYKVKDVINISGDLYSRMGTSFDIRLILIAGRKTKPEGLPPLNNPNLTTLQPLSSQVVDDWDNLFKRVNQFENIRTT